MGFFAIIVFMKNKKVMLCLVFLALALPLFADRGLGGEFGYSPLGSDSSWRAGVTLRVSEYPFVFGVFGNSSQDEWSLGGYIDYWMNNPKLFGMLHSYMGPGLVFSTYMDKDEGLEHLFFGTRLVLGANLFVFDFLETYMQGALEFGLNFAGDDGLKFPAAHFPLTAGFRFWF